MRALLDVNILLALFDAGHTHHGRALEWWVVHQNHGWASCPLTENGFLRIITGESYPRRLTMGEAVAVLRAQTALPDHQFWPDDVSLIDAAICDHTRILGPKQLTYIYLVALAVKRGGRLATLDRTIPIAAVRGAEARHLAVV